jgi:rSAM/selenodomain-associated transferase 1
MNRLAIFARIPTPGRVKTRLSPAIPLPIAAQLYRAMLTDALETAASSGTGKVSLFWDSIGDQSPGPALPDGVAVRHQLGADLGERLASAFAVLLAEPGDRAIVMGSDCPDLGPAVLVEAFAALEERDLVLGPARDGGYYLIGLRRPAPALFEEVTWGTGQVLGQTLERAEGLGLRVARLAVLDDIDTPEDLVRFVARRCVSPPGPGARTEEALRDLGLLPGRG